MIGGYNWELVSLRKIFSVKIMEWAFWVVALASASLGLLLLKVARDIWWTPLQLKNYFEAQGIGGPSYKLTYGNAPDIVRMAAEESSKMSLL